ncbi:TonB-dependent siderophore receptor [Paracoccus aminophilus]|uniref:TonB-dependent siderophore receptor n=1 Tax=Paracoccus aminophilus JCM 7686 TaxID=1367847 RepID=S5XZE5_PARAH|nr:TonB-dependent siderophore receptor [Paracoccus aminophilus]AGT10662.1 TonB-dependent siderophore receptor [Paracoccus aminophilus JCM 7686]
MNLARRTRLMLTGAALGCASLTPITTAPAWAQTATINVPAGPLEPALLALGRQAGLTLAYDSNLTAGRRTTGAQGALSPREALASVLSGTGLSYAFTGPRMVRLSAPVAAVQAASDNAITLDTVYLSQNNGVSEESGLYAYDAPTSSATGLGLTIRETPQSVSVVTNQRMVDAGDIILKDTLNQTPGVNTASRWGDAHWGFYARGSEISNLQFDGLSQPAASWGQESAPDDMVIYDRVEVVRGATGLMEGPGNPSASINLVRKRPLAEARNSLDLRASDYGRASVTLDSSQPLNESGSVRGRVVAYGRTGDTWRDAQSQKSAMIYGALDIDLTPTTTLGFGLSHQKDRIDGYAWGGLWVRPDGGSYDFRPSDNSAAAWEYLSRRQTVASVDLTHRFDNGWNLRLGGRIADSDREWQASAASWQDPTHLVRSGTSSDGGERTATFGARANGTVQLFGREHELAFGADWARLKTRITDTGAYELPIANPSRPNPWEHPRPGNNGIIGWTASDTATQWGVFASGRVALADKWHLIAGGRLAWYDYSNKMGDPASTSGFSTKAEPIPYVGLVYDIAPDTTLYGSYTGIFRPLSERNQQGAQLSPATGSNAELGLKSSLLDDGLLVSAALFQTRMDGLPEAVEPSSLCAQPAVGCSRAAETVTTRGLDFELSGAIREGWNISFGYTYADAAYSKGAREGRRFNTVTVPRHLIKLNTTYAFKDGLEGLTVGGSIQAQSDTYSEGTAVMGNRVRQSQGGYAVVDVMARYQLNGETAVQLNVDNLFDRTYLTGLGVGWPNSFYGQPRTVSLSLRKTF